MDPQTAAREQSITPNSIESIWYERSGKGMNLHRYSERVQKAARELREEASTKSPQPEEIARLRDLRSCAIKKFTQDIAESLCIKMTSNQFSWGIKRGRQVRGKQTYTLGRNNAEGYFYQHLLCRYLKKAHSIRANSRDEIVQGLIVTLRDQLPGVIYRTDVKSFYESIPHRYIREIALNTPLTAPHTADAIDSFLVEHQNLTGRIAGLPRGVALSATLAEVAMQEVDRSLATIPGTTYYSRFVDDIIIVIRGTCIDENSIRSRVDSVLETAGCAINPEKTKFTKISSKGEFEEPIQYLGYEISRGLTVTLSKARFNRLQERINRSYDLYFESPKKSVDQGLLLERLHFLAANYRLAPPMKHILGGIFYNNKLITTSDQLDQLDEIMHNNVRMHTLPESLKRSIEKISIKSGWDTAASSAPGGSIRIYSRKRLRRILEGWQD